MATYYIDEAAFELPHLSVVDRTVHAIELGPDLGLLLARRPFPTGRSLREDVAAYIDDERGRLRAFSLLHERAIEVAGRPALDLGVRWKSASGMIYQRQAHIALGDLVLLLMGQGPLEHREQIDGHVELALETTTTRSGA
jgi:hypothetical protein